MRPSLWLLFCLAASAAPSGCALVPATEWNATRAQNRALEEQNRVQLAEIDTLRDHNRVVEDRLIHAEKQLAAAGSKLHEDRELDADRRSEASPGVYGAGVRQ